MTVALYKYVADDGSEYKILLPSDFAELFDYEAGSESAPYIPDWISPRFANYKEGTLGLYLTATITEPFGAGTPPASIELADTMYYLRSAIGEKRGVTPQVVVVAGPQGPKGDDGEPGSGGGGGGGPEVIVAWNDQDFTSTDLVEDDELVYTTTAGKLHIFEGVAWFNNQSGGYGTDILKVALGFGYAPNRNWLLAKDGSWQPMIYADTGAFGLNQVALASEGHVVHFGGVLRETDAHTVALNFATAGGAAGQTFRRAKNSWMRVTVVDVP